jgi:hypothetical protein
LRDKCRYIKPNKEPCKLPANGQHGLCWAHAPENSRKRRRTASIGGRAKVNKEVSTIKSRIHDIIESVEGGGLERGDAAVMIQGFRAIEDFIELERRLLETDRLAVEIEELKAEIANEHKTAS